MAKSLCVSPLVFQVVLYHVLTGCAGESRTANATFHSTVSTSLSASYGSLFNFTSSHIQLNLTHDTVIPSIRLSTLSRTPFSTFLIVNSTSVTPTLSQSSTSFVEPRTIIFSASQTVPSVSPKNASPNRRFRNIEDVVSIAVLLSLTGICSIMLFALFVKFLIDLRRRNDPLINLS